MKPAIYIERDGKWDGPWTRDQLREFLGRSLVTSKTACREDRDGVPQFHDVEFYVGPQPVYERATVSSGVDRITEWPGLLGGALILGGFAGVVYFLAFFDTGVSSAAGRVNNLGLLQMQLLGVILSGESILIGVLVALFGGRR